METVGTKNEQENQKHWKLDIQSCARARNRRCRKTDSCRHITDARQLFFIDETGCNRHTLLRKYGLSKRGKPAHVTKHNASKGNNHSVIIARRHHCTQDTRQTSSCNASRRLLSISHRKRCTGNALRRKQ